VKTAVIITKRKAFTIVELLTIMSIIVILMSLLVPALNKVKIHAQNVKQRAQFHSISVGLDLFNTVEDGYPDSAALPPSPAAPDITTGAHRLAEAMVGRDLQGYDPASSWNAKADETMQVYGRGNQEQIKASLDRRKGPYLKLDNVGAFQVAELYGKDNSGQVYPGYDMLTSSGTLAPVLTDVYGVRRVTLANQQTVKAGSPILYYKADISKQEHYYINPDPSTMIYKNTDNQSLIELHSIKNNEPHHYDADEYQESVNIGGNPTTLNGIELFYYHITNPQITGSPRPYNSDSYILISAGYDGVYGTGDDICNYRY
jgi:type II secretory pathway pseudopilin PulG